MNLPAEPSRPRVLIADDDAAICTAVSRLLSPSCDVVGRAVDVDGLFDAVERLRPDVVLLDFSLPGPLNGLDVCRRLTSAASQLRVVAFTAHDDAELRREAHEAGFSGFVWKMDVATSLLETIHALVDGRAPSADTA